MELEVGANDLVKGEEESLGLSTPPGKETEQQEKVEKVVRSKETAKEEKESVGPRTLTQLKQDSRAGLGYEQVVKGKHKSVDTFSPIAVIKAARQRLRDERKHKNQSFRSGSPIWFDEVPLSIRYATLGGNLARRWWDITCGVSQQTTA